MIGKRALPDFPGGRDRIAKRHKIFEPTTMTAGGSQARVHLINVSETGALVHMAEPPPRGSEVIIDVGGALSSARLVWRSGRRFGVAFRSTLPQRTIDRLFSGRDVRTIGDQMSR